MKIVTAGTKEYRALFDAMRDRSGQTAQAVSQSVAQIIGDVHKKGWEAVCDYSRRFDRSEPYEVDKKQLEQALKACDHALVDALYRSADNIRDYQSKLLPISEEWRSPDGGTVGQLIRPLRRVGVYVPGGKAAYPSSVLMNIIPAKVAGVQEVIMVTPPTEYLSQAVLAAAFIAGVDRVFAVGGAQAVAALSYGAGDIPRVDKIVGPGNAYVAEAKRQLYGVIDIDMIAGPSEVLVIADDTPDPVYVAADLLSQAEHDEMASAILLTTSKRLADAVSKEINRQTAALERREVINRSLDDYGAIVICHSLEECAEMANEVAPEHLEIMTDQPRQLLPQIKNAGAVFLGSYTPEPLGDYMAGPSHVLPTAGTARFFSPLSSVDFLKRMSVLAYDRDALARVSDKTILIAQSEGLTAHANSIKVRFDR